MCFLMVKVAALVSGFAILQVPIPENLTMFHDIAIAELGSLGYVLCVFFL